MLHAKGAQLAFACVETYVRRLKRFVLGLDSDIIIPCDVFKDEDRKIVKSTLNMFEQIYYI